MRSINLVTESRAFTEQHFCITDLYEDECIGLIVKDDELKYKSQVIRAFGADLSILPCYEYTDKEIIHRLYYCPNEFYLIVDKGMVGFDSHMFVSKATVTITDTEYILAISLVNDQPIIDSVLAAYTNNYHSVSQQFNDYLYRRLNTYQSPVADIVKKSTQTPFISPDFSNAFIPVNVSKSLYELTPYSEYNRLDTNKPLAIGCYLYKSVIKGTVEILRVDGFSHDVYGNFYAMLSLSYVYPRDEECIGSMFPDFYTHYCIKDNDSEYFDQINNAETVSYITPNGRLGDKIIYQRLLHDAGCSGIPKDIFQFTLSETSTSTPLYKNVDTDINSISIGISKNQTVGTLIQVNGQYKIILYRCTDIVRHSGNYYAVLKYEDESKFFDDFTDSSRRSFTKVHHSNAFRSVEYLLCREKIAPVVISSQEYENSIHK